MRPCIPSEPRPPSQSRAQPSPYRPKQIVTTWEERRQYHRTGRKASPARTQQHMRKGNARTDRLTPRRTRYLPESVRGEGRHTGQRGRVSKNEGEAADTNIRASSVCVCVCVGGGGAGGGGQRCAV
jgi:hypothetical protein